MGFIRKVSSIALCLALSFSGISYPNTKTPAKDITTSGFTGNCTGDTNVQACLNVFDQFSAPSYSFEDSVFESAGTVTLTNDSAAPGNSKYYGTNGSGIKGFFDLPSSAVWGSITGTLSNQTDLQNALNAKQNTITTGTTAQYFRGDLSLATFPTAVSAFTNDAGYITASSADNLTNKTGNISMWTNDSGYLTSADLSGYVPYTGATADLDMGGFNVNAKAFSVTGTGGNGHIHLKHQSADATATGSSTVLFADSNGDLKEKNDGGFYSTFKTSLNTADRVYTFPNATGTLALTSDIPDLLGYALLAGRSGGQTLNGGTASGENLVLVSTSNATKGKIQLGTSYYDEVNNRLGINNSTPYAPLVVTGTTATTARMGFAYSNTFGQTYWTAEFSSGSQNGNVLTGYINQIAGTGTQWIQVLGNQTVAFSNTVTTTASIRTGLGSVSSAAVSASSDANTGLVFTGSDQMNIVTGGTTRVEISNSTTRLQFGSVSVPGIGFTADTDQGIYGSTGTVGISTGNYAAAVFTSATSTFSSTTSFNWSVASFTNLTLVSSQIRGLDGSASSPFWSFINDTNSGLYRIGADNIALSTNGTKALEIGSTGGVTVNGFTAATTGFIVKAAASQSARMTEWQQSNGTVVQAVGAGGGATFGDVAGSVDTASWIRIKTGSTSNPGLMIRGHASQTVDYLQIASPSAAANTADIWRIDSNGDTQWFDGGDLVFGTTTGTKIGTSTTQKIGFYNATPIVQGASISDPSGGAVVDSEARTAINNLISRLEAVGLIATV